MLHRDDHVFDVSSVSFLRWPNKRSPTLGKPPGPYGFNSFRIARPKFCFQEARFRFSKYVENLAKTVSRSEMAGEKCLMLKQKGKERVLYFLGKFLKMQFQAFARGGR